jgi:hypothetical protein
VLLRLARLFDRIERIWEGPTMRRGVAALVVGVFVATVILVELARRGALPDALVEHLPHSHFGAVSVAFWWLLAFEVVGLVLGLARSVANAAGKQFEIFSLILLRHSFEEFGHMPEPISWSAATHPVLLMVANAFGALLVFVVLGFYYAVQRHRPITRDARDARSFIAAKKVIALVLLAVFAVEAATALRAEGAHFFESFYTVIVFADVLIVLLSLRYSASYTVVFRNSGLAVATVLLRVALSAPPFYNAALGLASAVFALGVTIACNRFAAVIPAEPDEHAKPHLAGPAPATERVAP